MKIALIQFDPTIGDFEENLKKILSLADQAASKGCRLAVFPELCVCGYPPRDLLERKDFIGDCIQASEALIQKTGEMGVLFGTVSPNLSGVGKPIHNTAILAHRGKAVATCHKRLLPSYDIFDETRYFEPGDASTVVEFMGKRLGLAICEDIWHDEYNYEADPVADLAKAGTDIYIAISASPFDLKKADVRHRIVEHHVELYRKPFLYCNSVGGQDCLIFDGRSFALDQNGRHVAQARDFEEDLVIVDLEGGTQDIHPVSSTPEGCLIKALKLGLTDYMGRCGFKKVVLGLSGGIDSSVTAAIAVEALGPSNVTGVLMPSPYTSKESIEDAGQLAENLGIETVTLPISDIFQQYLDTLKPVFRDLPPDVTEENIQARIRGNLLMALSNKWGHMVLSTGNKTELAVGYCTLYGDLTGGYALISDVPKTMVYRLASYLNREQEIIPPRVITKAPSAELRPGQKDQDDLPPYELIDPILEIYLEENASIQEIAGRGYDLEVVQRIVSMVNKSEYKRQQAPFGPKVTTRAFGYGRRYPVAHRYRPAAHG